MSITGGLVIQTCAKQGDRFIPIADLERLDLEQPLYVDGSIRVTVGSEPLITDRDSTDIIHWWASLSKLLRDLSHGSKQTIVTSFPDSLTEMRFHVVGEKLT